MVKEANKANREGVFDSFGGSNRLNLNDNVPSADTTDELANKRNFFIDFFHLPSGRNVRFKSYITGFTDGFKSDWEKTKVFGRMDPAMTFKNTERVINVQWKIVSDSEEEAIDNYARLSELMRFLYPSYQAVRSAQSKRLLSATTINSPPLFRVKFLNWVTKIAPKDEQLEEETGRSLQDAHSTSAKEGGLIAVVDGFVKTPNMEMGVWDIGNNVYAKVIDISANLTILHENELGWDTDGKPLRGFGDFPYGLNRGVQQTNLLNKGRTGDEDATEVQNRRNDGAIRRRQRKMAMRIF